MEILHSQTAIFIAVLSGVKPLAVVRFEQATKIIDHKFFFPA